MGKVRYTNLQKRVEGKPACLRSTKSDCHEEVALSKCCPCMNPLPGYPAPQWLHQKPNRNHITIIAINKNEIVKQKNYYSEKGTDVKRHQTCL